MNAKLSLAIAPLAAIALLASTSTATAQDIEFMSKNGEKVELTPKVETLPGNSPIAEKAQPAIGVAPLQPNKLNQPRLGFGNLGDLRGRTFTVTDSDGNAKEISTDDARSITINRSFSSVNKNGAQQIKQGGTAIIVDADGQRYEVDLSQLNDGAIDSGHEGAPLEAKTIEVKKSYMIGVFCEPVPEMMRSQLNLGEGVGLIINRVQNGSPAADAGLKKFDILLYADDQSLSSVADLTNVITETGGDSQPFTLTVMRGGEEIPIELTAAERDMSAGLMPGRMPMDGFEMNDFGPGLIFGGDFDDDMMKQMQNHMQQVREEMKRMDGLLQQKGNPIPLPRIPMQAVPMQQQIR